MYFPSGVAWEKFVEEWKNSNRLYFANAPALTNVAPTVGCEGEANEGERREGDEELVDPNDTNAN